MVGGAKPLWLSVLLLPILSYTSSQNLRFPLNNCKSGHFDILLIGVENHVANSQFENFDEMQARLFINLLDVFADDSPDMENLIDCEDCFLITNSHDSRDPAWLLNDRTTRSSLPTGLATAFNNVYDEIEDDKWLSDWGRRYQRDTSKKRQSWIPNETTQQTLTLQTRKTAKQIGTHESGKTTKQMRVLETVQTTNQTVTLQTGKTTNQMVTLQTGKPTNQMVTLQTGKPTNQMVTLQTGKTTNQMVTLQTGKRTKQMVTPRTDSIRSSRLTSPKPVRPTANGWIKNRLNTTTEPVESRIRTAILPFKKLGTKVIFDYYYNNEDIKEEYLNAFKHEYSTPENEPTAVPQSNIEQRIELARRAFNDIPKSSSSAEPTRVAIMVVLPSLYANEIVEKVKRIQNQLFEEQPSNFHLFIILVGFYKDANVLNIRNTISVNSLSEPNYQAISMAICQQCKPGLVAFVHPPGRGHLYSCYLLHKAESLQTWHEAAEACKELSADLVSIETIEEWDFFGNGEHFLFAMMENASYLYVGLIRDQNSLNKHFQWKNKNPVTLHNWTDFGFGEEDGCIALSFRPNVASSFENNNDERLVYWNSISCALPMTHLAVCESVHTQPLEETASMFAVYSARNESFHKALSRGEFTSHYGEIVSVPLLSRLGKSNNLFLFFHCNENIFNGTIIPYSLVCDYIKHCSNGRDEDLCQYRSCTEGLEFRCDSGQCIPSEALCDAFSDCYDGSDERDCFECKGFRCANSPCLPNRLLYSAVSNCLIGNYLTPFKISEEKAFIVNDEKCAFICNRTECVYPSQFNDGVVDCQGPEGPLDETLGKLERSECTLLLFTPPLAFRIWAPKCVYIKDRYNTSISCWNNVNLKNCKHYECPEGYAHCPDSYCIPLHYVQDGNNDCPMGEDEQHNENRTCVGNFACFGSRMCLHPDLVCDRQPHCPHGDDELNCHVTCRPGFRCIAGTVTVTDYNTRVPLTSLSFVDSRVRYLDLSGVDLSFVKDGDNLVNMVDVRLSNCKLTHANTILAVSSSNLKTVYKIGLSENLIEEIHRYDIFNFMENLHILDLSRNKKLTILTEGAFIPFNKPSVLHTLDLSYTGLLFLHKSVLKGLTMLRILNLTGALITDYRRDNFPDFFFLDTLDLRETPIKHITTESFKGLTIQSNLYTDDFRLCCPQIRSSGIAAYKCHAPNNAFSSCTNLIREDVQRILLWFVGTVSVVGNVIVLSVRVIFERDAFAKSYGLFITNLGISDLMMGLYLLIIAGVDLKYNDAYVIYEEDLRNSMICQVAGFLSTLSSETSVFFIFLITVDRFLVINFPFGQVRFSKKSMILATILAWSLGLLLACVPLFLTVYSSNGMCLGLPLTTEFGDGWGYSVFVFVGLNLIMFLAIVCGQFIIYKSMLNIRSAIKLASTSDTHATRAQDISVAKRLSLVVLSDFLCWFPIFIMGVMLLSGHDIGHEAYAWSAILVIPVNSALNPMLYTLPIVYDKLIGIWNKRRPKRELKNRSGSDKLTEAEKSLFAFINGEPILVNFLRKLKCCRPSHLQDYLEQMALMIEEAAREPDRISVQLE